MCACMWLSVRVCAYVCVRFVCVYVCDVLCVSVFVHLCCV